jgi:hypothetical protein
MLLRHAAAGLRHGGHWWLVCFQNAVPASAPDAAHLDVLLPCLLLCVPPFELPPLPSLQRAPLTMRRAAWCESEVMALAGA